MYCIVIFTSIAYIYSVSHVTYVFIYYELDINHVKVMSV